MNRTERLEALEIERALTPERSLGDKQICIQQLEAQRSRVAEQLVDLNRQHESLTGQIYALQCDVARGVA